MDSRVPFKGALFVAWRLVRSSVESGPCAMVCLLPEPGDVFSNCGRNNDGWLVGFDSGGEKGAVDATFCIVFISA